MLKIILIALLLTSCATYDGKLRLTTLNNSKHFDQDKPYNESHNGLGLEYKITDTLYIGAMHYTNSEYNSSRAIFLVKEKPLSKRFAWGPFAGIANGYKEKKGEHDVEGIAGIAIRITLIKNFHIRILFTPILISEGLLVDL